MIGLLNGLFASLITRFTRHVRVVEPLIIFSTSYFAFLLAECVTEEQRKEKIILFVLQFQIVPLVRHH